MTIRFDAELGRALLPADQLDALISASARADWHAPALTELHPSGMVTPDGPHDSIAAALRVVTEPLCRVRFVERGSESVKPTCVAEAWLGIPSTALRVRRDGEQDEFAAIRTAYLPDELADLVSLRPRPRTPQLPFEVSAVCFADLLSTSPALHADAARHLMSAVEDGEVGKALQSVSGRLRRWWTVLVGWRQEGRITASQRLTVLDTEDGLWLALPSEDLIAVLPASSGDIWRVLTMLMVEPDPSTADSTRTTRWVGRE
ncbi:hypothetical protein Athai_45820 [Actinocatenispora thailandica]|uniref:ESX secretion-associated protein EspG n=1 Tax=Actinocatenispora thailandica TaxID=227318 RepID=A0A7R7DSK8_9ACTN|nr:ESX secretion-associated protein EspG [Actinocatenispora thailandica]BCJ37079.1 hypothetical protein Athai_45820 [Actinocatenispora thailandica]